jgi:hypothetical protein
MDKTPETKADMYAGHRVVSGDPEPGRNRAHWVLWGLIGGILLLHLVLLLGVAASASTKLGGWGGDVGLGVRFGEAVYWSPEVEMRDWEKVLMTIFWSYPLWLALGGYCAWRGLRKGRAVLALGAALAPFLPVLAGAVAITSWGMEVRTVGARFFETCQAKHPGVPGFIVRRGPNGETEETVKVVTGERRGAMGGGGDMSGRVTAGEKSSPSDAPDPTPLMSVRLKLGEDGRNWNMETVDGSGGVILLEMVPEGEEVSNWNELSSYLVVFRAELAPYLDGWTSGLSGQGVTIKETRTLDDGSVMVEYTSEDENGLWRFFQGPDGVYGVSYQTRPATEDWRRKETWRGILGHAAFAKNEPVEPDKNEGEMPPKATREARRLFARALKLDPVKWTRVQDDPKALILAPEESSPNPSERLLFDWDSGLTPDEFAGKMIAGTRRKGGKAEKHLLADGSVGVLSRGENGRSTVSRLVSRDHGTLRVTYDSMASVDLEEVNRRRTIWLAILFDLELSREEEGTNGDASGAQIFGRETEALEFVMNFADDAIKGDSAEWAVSEDAMLPGTLTPGGVPEGEASEKIVFTLAPFGDAKGALPALEEAVKTEFPGAEIDSFPQDGDGSLLYSHPSRLGFCKYASLKRGMGIEGWSGMVHYSIDAKVPGARERLDRWKNSLGAEGTQDAFPSPAPPR